jgi:hypothetical protein
MLAATVSPRRCELEFAASVARNARLGPAREEPTTCQPRLDVPRNPAMERPAEHGQTRSRLRRSATGEANSLPASQSSQLRKQRQGPSGTVERSSRLSRNPSCGSLHRARASQFQSCRQASTGRDVLARVEEHRRAAGSPPRRDEPVDRALARGSLSLRYATPAMGVGRLGRAKIPGRTALLRVQFSAVARPRTGRLQDRVGRVGEDRLRSAAASALEVGVRLGESGDSG